MRAPECNGADNCGCYNVITTKNTCVLIFVDLFLQTQRFQVTLYDTKDRDTMVRWNGGWPRWFVHYEYKALAGRMKKPCLGGWDVPKALPLAVP